MCIKVIDVTKSVHIMNLMEFNQRFPDEHSAMMAVKRLRENQGISCRKCGHKEHYWQQTIESFQCKKCGARQRLRSGTIMEHSQLSYRMWLLAIHLVTATKKSFSALELQRQLGHKRYEPVWYMLHKIRSAMGQQEARYRLAGYIELDDGYFTVGDPHPKPTKAGRGSTGKACVLVAVESTSAGAGRTASKTPKRGRKCGRLAMQVVDRLTGEHVSSLVGNKLQRNATVHTDGYSSYKGLDQLVETHHTTSGAAPEDVGDLFPWVHIAISNAKRLILGIHHHVRSKYLQNYLNEFCWKFNRRHQQPKQFDWLLYAGLKHRWC